MRHTRLYLSGFVLTAFGSLFAFAALAQGWIHFADREEYFSVNLPPQIDSNPSSSAFLAVNAGSTV